MSYTQSVIIRVNTPEVVNRFQEIGIIVAPNFYNEKNQDLLITKGYLLCRSYCDPDVDLLNQAIDCGTNIELALALAALRDDSDDFQWFIADYDITICLDHLFRSGELNDIIPTEEIRKGEWIKFNEWHHGDIHNHFHKATPEELKSRFSKTFYRVGNIQSGQGLWYDMKGNFTGLIHNDYSFCTNNTLQMPYSKDVAGYLSTVDNMEDLYEWFSKEDLEHLYPFGYRVLKYRSYDYKEHQGHYLIKQEIAELIEVVEHFRKEEV